MKLIEDSDECDDHTDDHRNVWIILERHAGSVCVAQGGNLISILVSLPLSKVMDLGPWPRLSLESMDSRKPRKATSFNERIVDLGEAYCQL